MPLAGGCGADSASPVGPTPVGSDPSGQPVITGVVFNNSPVDGDTYRANEEISVGLRFSEQVRVTGSSRLALTIGNAVRQATTYQDSSPMDYRSFYYTVQADDLDADGLGIAADVLTLNGGSIRNLAGIDADLDLGPPCADGPQRHTSGYQRARRPRPRRPTRRSGSRPQRYARHLRRGYTRSEPGARRPPCSRGRGRRSPRRR